MKKYFMKGTDDEVQFGDKIVLDLIKETKGGVERETLTVKFTELMAELLKEQGVIEEKEVKDKEHSGIDFSAFCKQAEKDEESLEEKIEELENRLTELEGIVAELTKK